jgi:hypothetical protein
VTETYVKVGGAAVAATTNDILIQPADAVLLNDLGSNSFCGLHPGRSAGARVNKSRLRDRVMELP